MQTVDASVILGDAYHMIGWDATQLETRQKQQARAALSLALQEVWESWWWQELMKCEQVNGATVYAANVAVVANDIYYFPATQKYYQALQASTGEYPATLENGAYAVNSEFWAETSAEPSAEDYSVDSVYELGDQSRSIIDGEVYQLTAERVPLVVSGSNYPEVNGTYAFSYEDGSGNPVYINTVTTGSSIYYSTGLSRWVLDTGELAYGCSGTSPLGTWVEINWASPVPVVVANAPGDGAVDSEWVQILAFTPEFELAGEVRGVGKHDLRNSNNGFEYDFERTLDGWRIPGWDTGVPWVWYRRPVPILTGDEYSSTATYTAAETITFN